MKSSNGATSRVNIYYCKTSYKTLDCLLSPDDLMASMITRYDSTVISRFANRYTFKVLRKQGNFDKPQN